MASKSNALPHSKGRMQLYLNRNIDTVKKMLQDHVATLNQSRKEDTKIELSPLKAMTQLFNEISVGKKFLKHTLVFKDL